MRKLADKQHSERATGCFGFGQRNERGDSLVEWETPNNFKIINHNLTISEESREVMDMEKP